MKVIIAGTRPPERIRKDWDALALWTVRVSFILAAFIAQSGYGISEVVCGEASGIDDLGARWARNNGIPVKSFPAVWRDERWNYDPTAGHKRNARMAEYADAALILWDGSSGGSRNMIDCMKTLRKRYQALERPDLWALDFAA